MKGWIIVWAVLLSILVVHCSTSGENNKGTAICIVSGYKVRIVADSANFDTFHQLVSGKLVKPARINGMLLKENISVREDGTLDQGVLADNQEWKGLLFEGNGSIGFFPNGSVAFATLVRDTIIGKIPVKAGTVYLHENGTLRSAVLSAEYNIRPSTLKALFFMEGTQIGLTDKGAIESGTIAQESTVQGISFPEKTTLQFYSDGTLEQAYVPKPVLVIGLWLGDAGSRPSEIRFHPKGIPSYGRSAKDQGWKGIPIPQNATVYFNQQGGVETISGIKQLVHNSISFTDAISFDTSGHLIKGQLSGEQSINGIIFGGEYYGEITFYANGRIKSGWLHGAQTIQGIQVASKSLVTFYENGKIETALLAGPQELQGLSIMNSGPVPLGGPGPRRETMYGVDLFASGKLKSAYLAHDHKIDGLLCRGGVPGFDGEQSKVVFHDNGHLAFGYLAHESVVQGLPLLGGNDKEAWAGNAIVRLYPSGKLQSGVLQTATMVDRTRYSARSDIDLYENGKVRSGYLSEDQVVQTVRLAQMTKIEFDNEGKLVYTKVTKDTTVGALKLSAGSKLLHVWKEERGEAIVEGEAVLGTLRLRAGTQISIDYPGKPVGFYLHSPHTLQGIAFPAGTYISVSEKGAMTGFTSTKACSIPSFKFAPVLNAEFDEDGILRKCFLAEPAIIQGIKFEKGKEVLLYRDGTLEEWQLPPDKLQKDRHVGKIRLLPDDRIAEKYASGQVEVVALAGNDIRIIDRIPYRHKITFYPSGAIKEVFVADTCHIQGLPIASQSNAEFYENAKLKTAFLGDSATIDGIAFRGDGFNESWEIGFFENGKVRKGFLNTPQLIGGKEYGTSSKLFFTKSGSVEKEELIEIEKVY